VRLVFAHGWALGPEMWDLLAPQLRAFGQTCANLGYFGAPALPDWQAGDVLVAHSAGLAWGLGARKDWAAIVAINAFSRFTLDESGRGCVRPAALRAMGKSLSRDPQACVNGFRASIGAPPTRHPAQGAALAQGLDLLRDFDGAPLTAPSPWLVLGAENDALAPASESRRLATMTQGKLALNASGGHGLPWTAPEFCAARIVDFLRAHA
jgi:pimeloyl-[acyl-carrier protein] methyl ester esterase